MKPKIKTTQPISVEFKLDNTPLDPYCVYRWFGRDNETFMKLIFIALDETGRYIFIDMESLKLVILTNSDTVKPTYEHVYGMLIVPDGESPSEKDCITLLNK